MPSQTLRSLATRSAFIRLERIMDVEIGEPASTGRSCKKQEFRNASEGI